MIKIINEVWQVALKQFLTKFFGRTKILSEQSLGSERVKMIDTQLKNDRRDPYLLYYKMCYAVQYILQKGPQLGRGSQVADHYLRQLFKNFFWDFV